MMVAGNYVSSTGGAGDARQFSIYVDAPLVRNLSDGTDESTKAVRTNLKNGADFIKILATGAILSKGITPGAQQFSEEEIRAAVVEAHRWGQVGGRARTRRRGDQGRAFAPASVRSTTAPFWMTRRWPMLKASKRQVFYVPTLYTYVAIDRTEPTIPFRRVSVSGRARSATLPTRAFAARLPQSSPSALARTQSSPRTARMPGNSPNA